MNVRDQIYIGTGHLPMNIDFPKRSKTHWVIKFSPEIQKEELEGFVYICDMLWLRIDSYGFKEVYKEGYRVNFSQDVSYLSIKKLMMELGYKQSEYQITSVQEHLNDI